MLLRFALMLVVGLGVLLDAGCAWHRKPKPRAAFGSGPIPVGTIALVDQAGKFVLIDNGLSPLPPVGGLLESFSGDAKSGELVATQVRRHPFTIADIRSGDPHKGDRVELRPVVGGAKAAAANQAAAPAPAPAPAPAGGVQ